MTEPAQSQINNTLIKDFSEVISSPISAYIAAIALLFTLMIALIDIQRKAKTSSFVSWFNFQCLIYALIFWLGNYVSSIFAIVNFRNEIKESNMLGFAFIAGFTGVFAFKGVLTNLNITFYKNGFLTIETWIEYALYNAVEKTTSNDIDHSERKLSKLLSPLEESTLNALIAQYLGEEKVAELEDAARLSKSNTRQYKQFALINSPQEVISKIINQVKKLNL